MGIPMKIWRKRMTVIVLSICLFLSGCAKTEIIGDSVEHDKLVDGVYEGSASGGPNKAVVNVTIKDQTCTVEPGVHAKPTTTIKMGDRDFLELIAGRLPAMQAYSSGKLKIEGDLMKSQLVEKVFKF